MLRVTLIVLACLSALMPPVALALDADLGETLEVQFGSDAECPADSDAFSECALRKKAAELGTPVLMYEHVRNQFDFALYQGSRSTSTNSFLGARGNDVDTASVLIAMLRSRGVPARYAVGTVRLESAKVMNWLQVTNLDLAVALLKDQGIQKVALSTDKATIDFEHVWVEALVSYANYRGAGPDLSAINCATQRTRCHWVGLAPAFKQRGVNTAALDLYNTLNFDYTRYYNAIKNNDGAYKDKAPLEIYQEQILDHLRATYPGKTLADLVAFVGIQQENLHVLPNSLPFQVTGTVRRYDSISAHDAVAAPTESKRWAKYIRLKIAKQVLDANGKPQQGPLRLFENITIGNLDGLSISGGVIKVSMAALTTRRMTITFKPCPGTANCIRTQLAYGNLTAVSDKATNAANPALSLNYMDPLHMAIEADGAPAPTTGTDHVITADYTNNVVGGYYLIGTGGDTSNWSQVHRASAELLAANQQYAILTNASGAPYVDANKNGSIDSGEKRLLDDAAAMDDLTGGLLYTAMNLYYARFRESIRQLDELNHVVSPIEGFVGVVSSVYDVDYVDGTAFSVMPGGLLIDMKGVRFNGNWRTNAVSTYAGKHFDLVGHIGSSLEHEIWQELTGYDAISTVRGIQFALAAGATLLNPKKNATQDTVPASYPGFGFATTAPSPFVLKERDVFTTRPATWAAPITPGKAFEAMKMTVTATDTRQGLLTYSSNGTSYDNRYTADSFIQCVDDTENYLNTLGANTPVNMGICDGQPAKVRTASQTKTALQNYYFSIVQSTSNPNVVAFFNFLDEKQGFVPATMAYRATPAAFDQHPAKFVWELRNNLYLAQCTRDGAPLACWGEYVIPGKLSMDPSNPLSRFSVYVRKTYETAGDKLISLGFIIQNMSVSAGGGYVHADKPIEQHEDKTGTVFNNEVFTNQNLNGIANNDLIRTPSTIDPVSTVTGNMYHDETDFVIKGRGLDYSFTRTYNSGPTKTNTGDGPLSAGWTHSYNMRLVSNDYGQYPNYPVSQKPENGNSKTSSISYVDERGGEVNYLVNDIAGTYAVTRPRGTFDELQLNTPAAGQYTLIFRNGVRYVFEGDDLKLPGKKARLKSIQDPYGNTLDFAYTSGGKLDTVKDNLAIAGRSGLKFDYELLNGRLSSVTDWGGRVWKYSYTDGKLVSMTNPKNQVVSYSYHPKSANLHQITWPQDRSGKKVTTAFRYYRNNKAFDYTNRLGHAETLDYDLYRKRTRVTDPRGFVREHYYDDDGALSKLAEPDGAVLLFDSNADGLRFKKTDGLGYQTQYSYLSSRALTAGASNTFGKVTLEQDPLNQKVEYDYGVFDQTTRMLDKRGQAWRWVYYSADNASGGKKGKVQQIRATLNGADTLLKSYTYFPDGNVKQQIEFIDPAVSSRRRITDYTYSPDGLNLMEVKVSGSGQIIRMTYTYDSLGRKKTETQYRRKSATDATQLQLVTAYDYDELDHVIKVTDPLGNIAETLFDANGKVAEERVHYRRADGSFDVRSYTRNEYDAADRLVSTTDVEGYVKRFSYDAAGNLVSVTDPGNHITRYEYDSMNRRAAVIDANGYRTQMEYDLGGRLVKTIDANGNTTRQEYDALGRKTKTVTAMGFETLFGYDGSNNLIKVTDANAVANAALRNSFGVSTYSEYDGLNRLTRVVDAGNAETKYEYDLLGNTIKVTDAESRVTQMIHDDLGRLTKVVDPLVETPTDKTVTATYDEVGNVLTATDRNGQVTRRSYDNLNRLTKTEFLADGTQENRTYDLYGNLETTSNAVVTYTYAYDSKNRLKKKTDSRLNKSLGWTYDPAGNLRTKTDYQGEVTTYQYDSTNRLVSMVNPGYVQVSYHYDAGGRLIDRILSSGALTTYQYDANNRLQKLTNRSAKGTAVHTQTYTYDRLTNIATMSDGKLATYSYDSVYRLKGVDHETNTYDQSYTYDKVGNRKTFTSSTGVLAYVYNAGNRLMEVRQTSDTGPLVNRYVYDDNGSRKQTLNATGGILQSYNYDQKRRVKDITAGTVTDSFQYDPGDYRIHKQDSSGASAYLLEAEHLEATYDPTGQIKAKYLRGAVIDEIVYGYTYDSAGKATSANYHHDHLQSVVELTGHDGTQLRGLRYDPFGNIQSSSLSHPNMLQYTGRERDADTGLYYYRARYYDAVVGRFLSEDPLGFQAGINFYAYVDNNPMNASDPTGHDTYNVGASLGFGGVGGSGGGLLTYPGYTDENFDLGIYLSGDAPSGPALWLLRQFIPDYPTLSGGGEYYPGPGNWMQATIDVGFDLSGREGFNGLGLELFAGGGTWGGNIPLDMQTAHPTGLEVNYGPQFRVGGTVTATGSLTIGDAFTTLFRGIDYLTDGGLSGTNGYQGGSFFDGAGPHTVPSLQPTWTTPTYGTPNPGPVSFSSPDMFGAGAGGGYVLYPSRSNANMMSNVYSK